MDVVLQGDCFIRVIRVRDSLRGVVVCAFFGVVDYKLIYALQRSTAIIEG